MKYIFDNKRQVGQENWSVTCIGDARKATLWERLFGGRKLYNSEKEAFIGEVLERSKRIDWGERIGFTTRAKMAQGLRDRMFMLWPDLKIPSGQPGPEKWRVKCLGIGYPHWREMEFLVEVVFQDCTVGIKHEFLAASARVNSCDFIRID